MLKILTQAQVDQFWNEGYVLPFDCLIAEQARGVRTKLEAYESTVDGDISKYLRVKGLNNFCRGFFMNAPQSFSNADLNRLVISC